MIANNINLVKRAVNNKINAIDIGAREARDEMMTTFIQLAQEEIKGQRGKVGGKWEKAISGEPPKNRTGNLRRSIRGKKEREGFANYTAVVGPTIIYGRSVEVGGKYAPRTWRHNEKFPYMKPAFDKFQRVVGSIIRKHLA